MKIAHKTSHVGAFSVGPVTDNISEIVSNDQNTMPNEKKAKTKDQ